MLTLDRLKILVILLVILAVSFLAFIPQAHTQSAQKLKTQDEIVREQMIQISRELSVTCTECHRVNNFKDDRKPNFKIAKEHIQIVELLKNHGFDGKSAPIATCYMCHRGELKPAYREGLKVVPKKVENKEEKKVETK